MRVSILVKLVSFTVVALLTVAVPIALWISSDFADSSQTREKEIVLDFAAGSAANVETIVTNLIYKTQLYAAALLRANESSDGPVSAKPEFGFDTDRSFYGIEVRKVEGSVVKRVVKEALLAEVCGRAPGSSAAPATRICQIEGFSDVIDRAGFPLASVSDGSVEVQNATLGNGPAVFILGVPLRKDESGKITHIALAEIDLGVLQKPFSKSDYRVFFATDKRGLLLAHSDESRVLARQDFSSAEIVAFAAANPAGKGQNHTRDSYRDSAAYSAYAKTNVGVTVFAESPERIILEPAKKARRKSFAIAGVALGFALFIAWLLSRTLTVRLKRLVGLSDQIATGNFDVQASENVPALFRDEVNSLASAFDHMTTGLRERDKVKSLFTKFHGSSVTEDLLKGEGDLRGQRKEVLVFFSDIRGFTSYSEKRDPEEVVEMLNEYFAVMVGIINQRGGVVDKFIGDAIMAIWGAPHSTERDAHNAVMACLLMRQGLDELNRRRIAAGKEPIMIGMGLHAGAAISGTIGSSERMEYTVIGNTVNTTSRIEASTKSFGTDLLVTEEVVNRVGDGFWLEYVGSAELKGRSEDIKLFRVRGYKNDEGEVIEVKTPYSQYEAEAADKVKVKESA